MNTIRTAIELKVEWLTKFLLFILIIKVKERESSNGRESLQWTTAKWPTVLYIAPYLML